MNVLFSLIAITLKYGNEDTANKIKNKLHEVLTRHKKDWGINKLREVLEIMKTCSYDDILGVYSMSPIGRHINKIIKSKLSQSNAFSEDLAKGIADVLEKKDLE